MVVCERGRGECVPTPPPPFPISFSRPNIKTASVNSSIIAVFMVRIYKLYVNSCVSTIYDHGFLITLPHTHTDHSGVSV